MRTLLSIAQNQALVKQKDRRTIFSLFQEIKTKKNIGESLLRDIINNSTTSNSCQQKRSRNSRSILCLIIFIFLVILTRFSV